MAKTFNINKHEVWNAYLAVKANKGSAGTDKQTMEEFDDNLKNNLYRIWNRLSSGSYFPPPVRRVEIPKSNGKLRPLGIPTISDRIAQTVIKNRLESIVEPQFHEDSYGYRPGKSALDAIAQARRRCWRDDWVLDMDIKGFFDMLDHDLVMKAVSKYTQCKWTLLYIKRWLKSDAIMPSGKLVHRTQGTPRGGVISPLLANIFLHLGFDKWMQEKFPCIHFERYADDIVVLRAMRLKIKEHPVIKRCFSQNVEQLAKAINPIIQGWINYYGRFMRSSMSTLYNYLNDKIIKWAMRKFKHLQRRKWRAGKWLRELYSRSPKLFAHWRVWSWVAE